MKKMRKLKLVFTMLCGLLLCCSAVVHAGTFTDNLNGTVTDQLTGLMWQQGEGDVMTWSAGLSYCEGLSLGGYSDWRLPNIKELESIADDTKYYPAIDTTFFPGAKALDYWSSTTFAGIKHYAWTVYFSDGSVGQGHASCGLGGLCDKVGGLYQVRCVRGGQSGVSDNCASTLSSSDLSIHTPILDYAGYHYWVDFAYVPDVDYTIVNFGEVSDLGPYNACTHATLSETTLGLHIPDLLFYGASYWADFAYKEGMTFTLFNYGAN